MSRGAIYIAFGRKYVDEAVFSAKALKSFSDIAVTLFTDASVTSPSIDTIVLIKPEHRRAKVDFISRSPYERTLYLDSDTQVVRDISDAFDVLERFDVAAVHDHSRKSSRWAKVIPEYDRIPYAFPEFNGGVMLFRRSERTDCFFDLWRRYFYRYCEVTNGQDQASLRISLWESDVAIHSLPFEYNVRNQRIRQKIADRASKPAEHGLLKPRILHWHGLNKAKPWSILRAKYRPMRF